MSHNHHNYHQYFESNLHKNKSKKLEKKTVQPIQFWINHTNQLQNIHIKSLWIKWDVNFNENKIHPQKLHFSSSKTN